MVRCRQCGTQFSMDGGYVQLVMHTFGNRFTFCSWDCYRRGEYEPALIPEEPETTDLGEFVEVS